MAEPRDIYLQQLDSDDTFDVWVVSDEPLDEPLSSVDGEGWHAEHHYIRYQEYSHLAQENAELREALKKIRDGEAFIQDRQEALDGSGIVNWTRDSASYMYLKGRAFNSEIANGVLSKHKGGCDD